MSKSREVASDMYSVGNVIFACFNNGHPIMESGGNVLSEFQKKGGG